MELAREITRLYHSDEETLKAENYFKSAYQQQKVPDGAPTLQIVTSGAQDKGQILIETLMTSGNYKSKSEIRRLLFQGAIKVDGEKVVDFKAIPDVTEKTVIQVGKGTFYRLEKSEKS